MKWQNGNFFDDSVAQKSCWVQFWGPKYMYYVTPKPILDIFWADRPRFNAKMSRQCPDAPFAVSGYAFDAFLANWRPIFQKENAWNTRFTKYRNTVGKYEKYKNGVCYPIVPSGDSCRYVIWWATVDWPRVNKQRNLGPTCQKSAKMCIFGAKNADFDPKIRISGPKSKTLCTTTMVCQYGNFFVSTVLHRRLLEGRRGQFWAQNTRILSLRSQFWTTFWANWPGFIDVSGYAFGGILANWRHIFQRVVLIILLSLLLYCAFLDQFKFFHFICFIFQISFQISKQNWP